MQPGLRVVRGPNWSWDNRNNNRDIEEGYVGTLKYINLPENSQTVIIHWDNGVETNCRVGHQGQYDLRVIDNAQIGVKHKHLCDGCDTTIYGMRFHCNVCDDYDLCYKCYHASIHDLTHPFKRFETTSSQGVNLPPRENARICQLKGIFEGATVVRAVDWKWGNQDGWKGNTGTVLSINGWELASTVRSSADVKWHHGNSDLYRIAHKGYCDIHCVAPASGGEFYPEHLPILGQSEAEMEWNGILHTIDIQNIEELEKRTPKKHIEEREPEQSLYVNTMSEIESAYADIIMSYSNMLSRFLVYRESITVTDQCVALQDMLSIAEQFKDKEIVEMRNAMQQMTFVYKLATKKKVDQQQFSEAYNKKLIYQATSYLEQRYYDVLKKSIVIEEQILKEMKHLGNGYPVIREFVRLRFKDEYIGLEDGTIDKCPIWPMVYYCLRVGDIQAALRCLKDCTVPALMEIEAFLDKKLVDPSSSEIPLLAGHIKKVYLSSIRDNSTDPYKRIVWAMLGRCDDINEALRTEEDFIWFKLTQVDCKSDNSYRDLQYNILEELGESHFDAVNKPLIYCKLLVLTGQFEAAFEFLYRIEKFKTFVLHTVILFKEINLISLPRDIKSPLLSIDVLDPKPARRLNVAILIKDYVKKIEAKSLLAAVSYLFFLRDICDDEGHNMYEVGVAELSIRTKEYVKILGKLEESEEGLVRTDNLIHHFCTPNLFENVLKRIECEFMKNVENWELVLDFYNTINYRERILEFMCSMLVRVALRDDKSEGYLRHAVEDRATRIAEEYSTCGDKGYSSLGKAIGLLTFYDLYNEKRYSEALQKLALLQIVPIKPEEIERTTANFQSFTEGLKKSIPELLLTKMCILYEQYSEMQKDDCSNTEAMKWAREQGDTVIKFAENLPSELMGDTMHHLIQSLMRICPM